MQTTNKAKGEAVNQFTGDASISRVEQTSRGSPSPSRTPLRDVLPCWRGPGWDRGITILHPGQPCASGNDFSDHQAVGATIELRQAREPHIDAGMRGIGALGRFVRFFGRAP